MLELTGKVALISGAARGHGAVEACLFVAQPRVVIGDILSARVDVAGIPERDFAR